MEHHNVESMNIYEPSENPRCFGLPKLLGGYHL